MARPHSFGEIPKLSPPDVVAFYVRHLPHWHPADADFFVTWRLYGSLPKAARTPVTTSSGARFVAVDRQLDRAVDGPLWLRDPEVADAVSQVLFTGMVEWRLYELLAWVVMANHVHVLIRPLMRLDKALMNTKSASARAANAVLGRTGHFWQDESYDHWVRNDRERNSIIRYIEFNPVAVGLVEAPEDWKWSSSGRPRMALPYVDV